MKNKLLLSSLLIFAIAMSLSSRAQVQASLEPGAVQQHSRSLLDHYSSDKKLASSQPPLPVVENVPPRRDFTSPLNNVGPTLLLVQVVTDSSEILGVEDIRQVTSRYEGRQVTMADLSAMVAGLNDLYARKGYTMARAVLPAQSVQDGVIKVKLVEGKVGTVSLQNPTHTRESYFHNRISLKSGEIIDVNRLQRDLARFNAINDLKLHAILQPGTAFGTADVVLQAEGSEDAEVTLFTDNAGRDSIGRYRGGSTVRFNSLFANRDPLSVGFLGANGTLSGYGSYSVPIGTRGLRFGGGFDYNTIEINSGPLEDVGIVGHAFDATLRLTTPIVTSNSTVLNAFTTAHLKKSLLQTEGFALTHTRVRSLEMGADYQRFDGHGMWFMSNVINTGFHDLGGSNTFLRYNGTVARVFNFSNSMRILLRGSGQVSALDPLPPIEQFQIGGVATVRGYPEGRLIGSNGYAATAELNVPMRLREKNLLGSYLSRRVTTIAFVDHGKVFDEGFSGSDYAHSTSLTSVGFGFVFNSRRFSGRIDVGFPVQNRPGIDSVGLHFYLQTTYPISRLWKRSAK